MARKRRKPWTPEKYNDFLIKRREYAKRKAAQRAARPALIDKFKPAPVETK